MLFSFPAYFIEQKNTSYPEMSSTFSHSVFMLKVRFTLWNLFLFLKKYPTFAMRTPKNHKLDGVNHCAK